MTTTQPPKATWTTITPDMAEAMLTRNTDNRGIRRQVVARYARDMVEGNWAATGDGIRVSTTGRLLDGQHRLAAIVRAKVPVSMYVFEVDDTVQVAMDSGVKRTAADHLGMKMGVTDPILVAGVARLALSVEMTGTLDHRYPASTSQVAAWVAEHEEVHDAVNVSRRVSRAIDATPTPVAYAALVLSGIDAAACREFFYAAATRANLSPGDPRLVLGDRFANARRSRERVLATAQISAIFRCWNAWVKGEKINRLLIASRTGGDVEIPKPLSPKDFA